MFVQVLFSQDWQSDTELAILLLADSKQNNSSRKGTNSVQHWRKNAAEVGRRRP